MPGTLEQLNEAVWTRNNDAFGTVRMSFIGMILGILLNYHRIERLLLSLSALNCGYKTRRQASTN